MANNNLTASQIAAQAAMQHQAGGQHMRRRSQTVPVPEEQERPTSKRSSGSKPTSPALANKEQSFYLGAGGAPKQQYQNGLLGNGAATTAANVAFPRSPGLHAMASMDNLGEKEPKQKAEKSKMKLFSKPKHIGINRDKSYEKATQPLPSPNKMGPSGSSGLSRMVNASNSSLVDTATPSLYSQTNASTSTIQPSERQGEKAHKHHFLSRPKLKTKDKDETYHNLPLSSAASNSVPVDPSAPQPLYSFAPSSPATTTSAFAKSVSGLDLRHGGRAIREKKKDVIAQDNSLREGEEAGLGDLSAIVNIPGSPYSRITPAAPDHRQILNLFGLNNMTADDAWDFLKAKILIIFEGEDVRIAVEDLNRLVTVYLQSCITRRRPYVIMEDVNDLLLTGFTSLNHTLRAIADERLIPHLVHLWLFAFGTVLPFMQAVFFPLDLELKGASSLQTPEEAAEFWSLLPGGSSAIHNGLGETLDIRHLALLKFRDVIMLSRYDILKALFSRLSLDSINPTVGPMISSSPTRPSTAHSLDPGLSSFNSQGSTLLSGGSSEYARSRATSNTSAPDVVFQSPPHTHQQASIIARGPTTAAAGSSHVTEIVGRMLQCVSVLASLQTGDESQQKMESLSKAIKLNWLGRGRTGRNRRGFVGARVRPIAARGDGSPTPTPTRNGGSGNVDEDFGVSSML